MNYWLMKSEPDMFGINDLYNRPNQTEHWDGVRNYQARNMMRDAMKLGDQVFFLSFQLRPTWHCRHYGSWLRKATLISLLLILMTSILTLKVIRPSHAG